MAGLFDNIFSGSGGVAETLIALAGKTVSYYQYNVSREAYNPLTGEDIDNYLKVVTIDATPFENYKIEDIDGTNIKKGDMKTYINPLSLYQLPVLHKDYIIDNGVKYFVKDYTIYDTGSEVACYEIQLRQE